MAQVYVSVGSNIERRKHIDQALALLGDRYGRLEQSAVYESDAVGFDSNPFYNMVVGFDTDEPPHRVQRVLHDVENDCGRVRTGELSARTMDLDLLLYDDLVTDENGLVLPREDITRYAFVLYPLAELAPDARHPVSGRSFADIRDGFSGEGRASLRRVDWTPRS